MMLQSTAFKLLLPQDALLIERGRCLRHRLSSSSCRNCFTTCATGALTWTETGLDWDKEKCTGCMLCAADCPTDALTSNQLTVGDLLQRLDEVDTPLLACSFEPQTQGHARVPCLGLLADPQLLLVLQLALGKELRLNASACATCENCRMLPELHQSAQQVAELAQGLPGAVKVIESAPQLDYREKSCSRREFFNFLNRRSRQTGMSLVTRLHLDTTSGSYGKKNIPKTRQLLLQLGKASSAIREMIDSKILRELTFVADCRGCTACVGICPTGALASPDICGNQPQVNKDRCIACNLCVEFCRQSAITVTTP
ncbi:4Fe-4S binding protein [Pelovirga terrestris]|uniref:4Fe-4S binding protein n=1 Tax=Pelovirga terrestris TaxID=2771352 RepID=A0A8J6UQZ6_9BACT|nr:4Fe-4S binding protein [Pelovirga terrestris]MBD1400126.1 4Fe-4S binding protein [Pelovirga terrestris]